MEIFIIEFVRGKACKKETDNKDGRRGILAPGRELSISCLHGCKEHVVCHASN